nr:unnamed protein product [Naegleria fowleri]
MKNNSNNNNIYHHQKDVKPSIMTSVSETSTITTTIINNTNMSSSATTSPTSTMMGESSLCSLSSSCSSPPLATVESHDHCCYKWRERLFPHHFIQKISHSNNFKRNEMTLNSLEERMNEEMEVPSTTSSSSSSFSSKTTLETELLDFLMQELSSMNEDELSSVTVPDVVEYLTNHLKYSSKFQQCSLVHLAARHNRVELLQWMKRCCCDKKCVFKPIQKISISANSNGDKKEAPSLSPMFEFSSNPFKRFSRNFGRNFNIATQHVEYDEHQNSQHSKACLAKQHQLWSVKDQNLATPLFYACYDYSSIEAAAFLLSQPTVSSKQLNHHHDHHGNLPITIGFRNKNFKLCDLLVLFGARIDVTSGLLGESLLHRVCRDGGDIESVKYLAQHSPKIILKRNQRDENALFACIADLRTKAHSSSPTGLFLSGHPSTDSRLLARKSTLLVSDTSSCHLLHHILDQGLELFGKEIFEKAVQMKNSFGHNILMKSIVYNDIEAMKVICLDISNYCQLSPNRLRGIDLNMENSSPHVDLSTEGSPRKRSYSSPKLRRHSRTKSQDKKEQALQHILKSIVFDRDKQGKTILIHFVELGINIDQDSSTQEELEAWFDGFQWLLMWLYQNFSLNLNNKTKGVWSPDCGLSGFFEARDHQGISAYGLLVGQQPEKEHNFIEEGPKTEDESSLFWPRVLECTHSTIAKWAETEKEILYNSILPTSATSVNDFHQPKPLSQKSKSFRYTEAAYDMSENRSRFPFTSQSDSTGSSNDSK